MIGLALAVFSDVALAAAKECSGLVTGKVSGGVVVNDGDVCILGGANVSGGVRVNGGGTLIACGSTINGGLVTNGAAELLVGPEEIGGCLGDVINGGVHISNTGPGAPPGEGPPSIALENSTIHGGVFLSGNAGPIAVAANTIAGGLFCSNNAFNLDPEDLAPTIVTGAITCKFE
jgi:hypothetical protein